MQLFYEEASNKPGIYKIINTHTNRVYIGQAQSFKQRWAAHIAALKSGKHQNRFMRNDFNKCLQELKDDNFIEFHVLEIMEGSTKLERNKREEEIIAEHYDSGKKCYNLRKTVNIGERSCYSSTPEETSKKKSEAMKRAWQNPNTREERIRQVQKLGQDSEIVKKRVASMMLTVNSEDYCKKEYSEEAKQKLSAAHKGKKHSKESKEKISKALKGKVPSNLEQIQKNRVGTKHTEECKQRMSESHKNTSDETRQKMRETHKKLWEREGYREKMSEAHKKQTETILEECPASTNDTA